MASNAARQLCPADPSHGEVWPPRNGRGLFYCSHAEHDGRLKSSPLGYAPRTRAFFTRDEVERGQLSDAAPSTAA